MKHQLTKLNLTVTMYSVIVNICDKLKQNAGMIFIPTRMRPVRS